MLRAYKLGEADRICVLATLDHGKVRAVAKGVRRLKSRIGARLEPLNHVNLMLWEGRNLDIINQVEVLDTHVEVRNSLEMTSQAQVMLEVAVRLFLEKASNVDLYTMLVKALSTLETWDSQLILPAFLLKVLVSEGVGPALGSCIQCSETENLVAYSTADGGVLCNKCRRGRSITPEALMVMRKILGGGLALVLAETFSNSVSGEVRSLATEAMEHHLEARLKSMEVLEKV